MPSNSSPSTSRSAQSAWIVLASGEKVNIGDALYAMRVPDTTVDVDAEVHAENALSAPVRLIRCGGSGGGDITLRFAGDAEDRTIANVQPGEYIQGVVTHVRDSTTATGLLGWV